MALSTIPNNLGIEDRKKEVVVDQAKRVHVTMDHGPSASGCIREDIYKTPAQQDVSTILSIEYLYFGSKA